MTDVERELFGQDGVASVQPVATSSKIVKDGLDDFTAVFRVLELFILLLAVLIAYNATSINADQRARERATSSRRRRPQRPTLATPQGDG